MKLQIIYNNRSNMRTMDIINHIEQMQENLEM